MATRSGKTSTAERVYRLLVRLYPRELRRRYEAQMVSVFRDMEANARSRGRVAWLAFVTHAYFDVLATRGEAQRYERKRLQASRPREERGLMSTWKHDGILAVRFLRKQPGFTLVAVVTLALGIGANTAIFSVLYGTLLRPLGLARPEALDVVRLHRIDDFRDVSGFHPTYLDDLRNNLEASGIAAFTSYVYESITLVRDEGVSEIDGVLMVDGAFFEVMGATPLLGRTFDESDVPMGRRGNVCVIGESLWRGRFGGDPQIVGRTLNLDEEPVVVVGVVPAHLPLPDPTAQLWMPQGWDVQDETLLGRLNVVARLREPELRGAAQAALSATAVALGRKHPRFQDYTMTLIGFRDTLVGNVRPAILLAAAGVALILLIACANTASLLLSRATTRATEMATRRAIGARRSQLASQLLSESLALAVSGGLVGVLAARAFHRILLTMAPADLPRLAAVELDLPVLAFSVAITLLTGLLFGLVPLAHASRHGTDAWGARSGPRRGWASHGLVITQVALSVVLLVSAALMTRSLLLLQRVPLGFTFEGVAGARVYLDDDAYPEGAQRALYFSSLLERLRARPEMESAGASSGLPMDPVTIDYDLPYTLPGEEPSEGEATQSFFRTVTPGYFEAMGIPLKAGRTLDARDHAEAQKVALVNETFARLAWPESSPVGRSFLIYGGRVELQVIGVVGDVHFGGPADAYKPEFFVPHDQVPYSAMTIVVRSRDARAGARAIAEEALQLNGRQPVHSTFTMETLVAGTVATDRFLTFLLVSFALVALVISAAGIYGVISSWVSQSRRELGVRMAFGAGLESILALVLRRGLGMSFVGMVVGLLVSFAATRLLARFLYGVGPNDALAIGAVVVLLGITALLATFLPAWRAAHSDPMASLRTD